MERAAGRIEILVGAGVSPANLPALTRETGASAFHLSGKQILDSRMTFRREGVPMGLPGFSEFELWQTSEDTIRNSRTVLDTRHIQWRDRFVYLSCFKASLTST